MQNLTRRSFTVSVPGLLLGCGGSGESTPVVVGKAPQFAALSDYMLRIIDELQIPGASVCVAHAGRIIERRTGMDYEAATRKFVLDPAGATSARIGRDTLAGRFAGESVYYDDPHRPASVRARRLTTASTSEPWTHMVAG